MTMAMRFSLAGIINSKKKQSKRSVAVRFENPKRPRVVLAYGIECVYL